MKDKIILMVLISCFNGFVYSDDCIGLEVMKIMQDKYFSELILHETDFLTSEELALEYCESQETDVKFLTRLLYVVDGSVADLIVSCLDERAEKEMQSIFDELIYINKIIYKNNDVPLTNHIVRQVVLNSNNCMDNKKCYAKNLKRKLRIVKRINFSIEDRTIKFYAIELIKNRIETLNEN